MTIESFPNIAAIADRYDALLLDLWGVIHDGQALYPEVVETLEQLHKAGKHIVFLSNAPRRSIRAVEGLQRLGVPDGLYDQVVTSGEAAFDYLTGQHEYGKYYFMIGPERDNGLLDGTDFVMVRDPKDADFAIVTGFDHDAETLEDKQSILDAVHACSLPMICTNPDEVVVRLNGTRALCAGALARAYEAMGGSVRYFGKPYQEVYDKALSLLHMHDHRRVAAIGDNLDTDILGANHFQIDSYLIAGGILGEKLGIQHGQLPEIAQLESLCCKETQPKAVLPAFIW